MKEGGQLFDYKYAFGFVNSYLYRGCEEYNIRKNELGLSIEEMESIFLVLCKKRQNEIDARYGISSDLSITKGREKVIVEPAILENIKDFCEQIIKKAKENPNTHYIMKTTSGTYDIDKLIKLSGKDLEEYLRESSWVGSDVLHHFYDKENRDDKQVILDAIRELHGMVLTKYASERLQNDPQCILKAIAARDMYYGIERDLKWPKDKNFLFAAMKAISLNKYSDFNCRFENLTHEAWEMGTNETDFYDSKLGKIWNAYCTANNIPNPQGHSQVEYNLPDNIIREYIEWLERVQKKSILQALSKKTVVTHFGADLDNVASIEALERFARENGILQENEHLDVKRVPAGQVMEGFLNIDTGGHKGSRTEDDGTVVIDGNPLEGINSAAAMLASLGVYVPEQIVELADTVPNKVNPLESRTALSLIRNANGSTIFKLAEAGLLDKQLTDEQLEKFELQDAHRKQEEIIANAVEKINKYMTTLPTGEKVVIAPEQILGGAPIAYELGANYYASVEQHKSGKGSTFAVTSKPGVQLPKEVQELGEELVEQYKNPNGTSGVFLNPNGQMLVAGGPKNPDFSVEYTPDEVISKLTELFEIYAERINANNKKYSVPDIVDVLNLSKSQIDEVMEETAKEASTQEIEQENKNPEDNGSNPGGNKRE